MKKKKDFNGIHFSAEVLIEAYDFAQKELARNRNVLRALFSVSVDGSNWDHDSFSEFIADYRRSSGYGVMHIYDGDETELRVCRMSTSSEVSIAHKSRAKIEESFALFERHAQTQKISPDVSSPITSSSPSISKSKEFDKIHFEAEIISEVYANFEKVSGCLRNGFHPVLSVETDDGTWGFNSFAEFIAEYARTKSYADIILACNDSALNLSRRPRSTSVMIKRTTRAEVEALFSIFDRHAKNSSLPDPPKSPERLPQVFIGHGRNDLWRDLKDHLHDRHGFAVQAYEIGARAGYTVKEVLEEMMDRSNFALLVATGEDFMDDGSMRARQNVVHEIGLFQGRLGFKRAIVLLEKGTEEFSNIHGVAQIRFDKGNIKESFGDVVATIRREFSSK